MPKPLHAQMWSIIVERSFSLHELRPFVMCLVFTTETQTRDGTSSAVIVLTDLVLGMQQRACHRAKFLS